jgi:pimeloyl-ACP methyl ester carboxylesterase
LHDALHQTGIAGPYILVGHAFGGDNVRAFADIYTGEVAGLVLVDADTSDVEPAAMRAADHRFDADVRAELRACRDAVATHRPLPPLKTRPGEPPQNCAQQFFRGLPEAEWSTGLNAELLKLAETKVALYDAVISEWEQMKWDETWLQQHRRSLGSRPVRVLTTGNHAVHFLKDGEHKSAKLQKYEDEIKAAQARWLSLSSDARQIFTRHSSEYVNFDEPDTLVSVIREVYDKSK